MRLLAALMAACALEGRAGPAPLDCERVALRDGLGDPDPCDVAACEACVRACGSDCAVLETWPPLYGCGGREGWDVRDACPGWTSPQS